MEGERCRRRRGEATGKNCLLDVQPHIKQKERKGKKHNIKQKEAKEKQISSEGYIT